MSRTLYRHFNSLTGFRRVYSINKLYYQTIQRGPGKFAIPLFTHEVHLHTSTALHKVIPYNLSDIGEGIFEVSIKEWYVQPGDTVKQFQEICEVQSDKAAVTITCRYDGVITKLYQQQDGVCKVGTPLIDIEVSDDVEGEQIQQKQDVDSGEDKPQIQTAAGYKGEVKVLATPPVRKLAKDLGINISAVIGTGKDGRILKEDVYSFAKPQDEHEKPTTVTWEPRPVVTSAEDRVTKLTLIQKVMIQTMTLSGRVPQFGYCEEIKAGKLREFKKLLQDVYGRDGVSFTYMPIFLKATSIALSRFPILNSVYDESGGCMVYKPHHNIGLAMDTPHGLLVPNVKNVEQKSIVEIAVELMEMHKMGVAGRIQPDQLTGGTFSISNIGAIGGTYARPMILPPEVCIVAIGKIYQPGGTGEHIINTSYSADHRVIDGATVSRFSNFWKGLIEEPALISAELT